jgi:hypothetical protein
MAQVFQDWCDSGHGLREGGTEGLSRRSPPWVWYAATLGDVLADPSHGFVFTRFLDAVVSMAGVAVGESWGNMEGRSVYSALYEGLGRVRAFQTPMSNASEPRRPDAL